MIVGPFYRPLGIMSAVRLIYYDLWRFTRMAILSCRLRSTDGPLKLITSHATRNSVEHGSGRYFRKPPVEHDVLKLTTRVLIKGRHHSPRFFLEYRVPASTKVPWCSQRSPLRQVGLPAPVTSVCWPESRLFTSSSHVHLRITTSISIPHVSSLREQAEAR